VRKVDSRRAVRNDRAAGHHPEIEQPEELAALVGSLSRR